MTNPTPMTRARELLTHWVDNDWFMPGYDGNLSTDLVIEHLAAALDRERREGMERACACVCDLCRISVPEIHQGEWCHRVGKRDYRLCEAASIRAKMDTPATE